MMNSFLARAPMASPMTSPDGLALMANGGEQGAEIVDAAEEDAADQDPQHNGDPAEHSGLDGAVDGACAGDRGK